MNQGIYGIFVFLHVISAVLSIGPLFLLMPIIKKLHGAGPDSETAYLSIIKTIIRIVMHAGHALIVTGTLLLIFGPWPWHASWIIATIIVLLLSGFFLSRGFSVVLKKFNVDGFDKNDILIRLNRTSWVYISLMVVMLWLMVQKPVLW